MANVSHQSDSHASIPLGFTPVPITGQTFAVLLAGGVLGANRGALSMSLYVALDAIGLPFYADASGGWTTATGATAGHLVGFGATWLAIDLGIPLTADAGQPSAIAFGVAPFIVGDIIKALLAGTISPAAWILAEDRR